MTDQAFADTAFFVAILSRHDEHHRLATDLFRTTQNRIFTSNLILIELGNFMCAGKGRALVAPLIAKLEPDRLRILRPHGAFVDPGGTD